jgi:acyl carrier protein
MIKEQLIKIFIETFSPTQPISFEQDISIGEIPEWDSFGNFNFLVSIEEHFSIRFTVDEMSELKSFFSILKAIETHNSK